MSSTSLAFDDFVDDCFIEEDPICGISSEKSLELVPSQVISELISEDESIKAS